MIVIKIAVGKPYCGCSSVITLTNITEYSYIRPIPILSSYACHRYDLDACPCAMHAAGATVNKIIHMGCGFWLELGSQYMEKEDSTKGWSVPLLVNLPKHRQSGSNLARRGSQSTCPSSS
jgi:hypothetical protein